MERCPAGQLAQLLSSELN